MVMTAQTQNDELNNEISILIEENEELKESIDYDEKKH